MIDPEPKGYLREARLKETPICNRRLCLPPVGFLRFNARAVRKHNSNSMTAHMEELAGSEVK